MKIKEVIKILKTIKNQEAEFYVACDEEWNTIFTKFKIEATTLKNNKKAYIVYGLDGTHLEN